MWNRVFRKTGLDTLLLHRMLDNELSETLVNFITANCFIFVDATLLLVVTTGCYYWLDYCNGLLECPIIVSPFIIMQQTHFCCKQILDFSCLQIRHIQDCLVIVLLSFFCLFVLALRYSHNTIIETPIIVKIKNIITPARSISNTMLNIIMTRP